MLDDQGNVYYYLNDHLGSAAVVINSSGTVRDKHRYQAFGGSDGASVVLGQAYRYTGKPLDEELDLDWYYYGARYYDPSIGRFPSIDPLRGKYPGWSPYAYCLNNPLSLVDDQGDSARSVADKYSAWTSTYIDMARSGELGPYAQNQMGEIDALSFDVYYSGGDVPNEGGTNVGETTWDANDMNRIEKIDIKLDIGEMEQKGISVPNTAVEEGRHALDIADKRKTRASLPLNEVEKAVMENRGEGAKAAFKDSNGGHNRHMRKMQEYRKNVQLRKKSE